MANFIADFREVLERGEDLPTLPNLVFELHAALDREHIRTEDIAGIVEKDPAMATRLLRVANSAAFNRGREIESVGRAVAMLGLNQVRALSLALAVVRVFSKTNGGLGLRAFWQHSAAVGFVARSLAVRLHPGEVVPGQMYLGGLLHDVGLLLLDQFFPKWLQDCCGYAKADARPLSLAEINTLGIDHGGIGGFLLGRWGLPPLTVQMVANHTNPSNSPPQYRNACWTVYTAEHLCSGHGPDLPVESLDGTRADRITDALRQNGYDVDGVLNELAASSDEMAAALP